MPHLIRFTDITPVPWKNGAGTTRELFCQTGDDGEILIRISLAEIEGAQGFSKFAGLDRIIMQLDGPPMDLVVDGKGSRLKHETPFPFSGDAETSSIIHGIEKAHDLNLMCNRKYFRPNMSIETFKAGTRIGHNDFVAVFVLAPCRIDGLELAAHDVLIGANTVHSDARVAVLTAERTR